MISDETVVLFKSGVVAACTPNDEIVNSYKREIQFIERSMKIEGMYARNICCVCL